MPKNLHRNIVGPEIRRIRSAKGLSQSEFAVQCQRLGWDISRDIVARIELQVRWVADFELLFLAEALDVDVLVLFPKIGLDKIKSQMLSRPT